MADESRGKPAKVVPLKGRRCPICRHLAVEAYRPFCSKACADRDLDRWLTGAYRVPVEEEDDSDEPRPEED